MSENNIVSILMEQISLLEKENKFLRAKIVELTNDAKSDNRKVESLSELQSNNGNTNEDKDRMDYAVDMVLKYAKAVNF